jgi:glycogen phosphorylase
MSTDLRTRKDTSAAAPAQSSMSAFQRQLCVDQVIDVAHAGSRERFEALASVVRELISERWLRTRQVQERVNPKRVYYLSMEFLIGRTLTNNISNLMAEPFVRDVMSREGIDWHALATEEPDAGLGNGGLGRLAACFVESLASLQIPAHGYGLRYQYGIFRQEIRNGYQVEQPDNWLSRHDPWEVVRPRETIPVKLGCTIEMHGGVLRVTPGIPSTVLGVPYDRPVVGYGGKTVNTLRLWGAASAEDFDFGEFSSGDFVGAVHNRVAAETLTRVLYPDDSTTAGQVLRLLQEYFLVACSLGDIIKRFQRTNTDWNELPNKIAIQMNDTHPALSVAELMRILLDQGGLPWDQAWDITRRSLAYTNHTLLPEALEKWGVRWFEIAMPRHLEIIYEINRRFLDDVRKRYPNDTQRLARMSIIEDTPDRKVRMAHLAIVGSHSTNGVARIHSDLLKTRVVADFAEVYPERFNNKTNGVTPRRWLLQCNPSLASLITEAVGKSWPTDLSQLRQLGKLADDSAFRERFRKAKRQAKATFADWVKARLGQTIDPDTIFDCQIKRIHEYKRQLLNILHVIVLYNRMRSDSKAGGPPRTFFFSGKAAPAYVLAKLIIKLINNVAEVIDNDKAIAGRLKVLFLPDYRVTLAERLIPAADVSEQISTAGYEASGTGNMKFMMNGALTIGTRDGATIEMAEEAGEENFFLFGLTADQVVQTRGWYQPQWHYQHELETKAALDLIFSNHFSRNEPGIFQPIYETLLTKGDYYMHLADLTAYTKAHEQLGKLYADAPAWAKKAILNVAYSGKFSSDRTINEYAREIWKVVPCPVE